MQDFENIIEQAEAAAQENELQPMDLSPYFVDFTKDIERPTPVISDASNPERIVVSEQNIFTIAGEAKSRKSFLATLLVIDFFRQHEDRKCIMVDTEQAEWNVLNIARRVCRGMGWNYSEAYESKRLQVAHLRPFSKDERLTITEAIISQERPYLCIIDGARDMVQSVNDDEACSQLVDKFLKWSEIYQCAIGTIVHTNKDGETVRGHLGSELINKSETVLFCKKDGEQTKVSSLRARNIDIDSFYFGITESCVPVRSTATETAKVNLQCGTAKETQALQALKKKEAPKTEWLLDIRTAAMCAPATAEKYFDDYVQKGFLRICSNGTGYGHFLLYGPDPIELWPHEDPTLTLTDTEDKPPF